MNLDAIVPIIIIAAIVKGIFQFFAMFTGSVLRRDETNFADHFHALSLDAQSNFLNTLSVHDQINFQNMIQQQQSQDNHLLLVEQFNQWTMDEGIKSVTPFDHGVNTMCTGLALIHQIQCTMKHTITITSQIGFEFNPCCRRPPTVSVRERFFLARFDGVVA